jgi:hypothetical protein
MCSWVHETLSACARQSSPCAARNLLGHKAVDRMIRGARACTPQPVAMDVALDMSVVLDECMAMHHVPDAHRQWVFIVRILMLCRHHHPISVATMDDVVKIIRWMH